MWVCAKPLRFLRLLHMGASNAWFAVEFALVFFLFSKSKSPVGLASVIRLLLPLLTLVIARFKLDCHRLLRWRRTTIDGCCNQSALVGDLQFEWIFFSSVYVGTCFQWNRGALKKKAIEYLFPKCRSKVNEIVRGVSSRVYCFSRAFGIPNYAWRLAAAEREEGKWVVCV